MPPLKPLSDVKICDETQIIETRQLLSNLVLNMLLATVLVLVFEGSRHIKSIYMKRMTKDKFVKGGRVPEMPSTRMFGWLKTLYDTSEEDVLHMVGLDGYMLLRYVHACGRICAFISFWGLTVLVPFYGFSGGKECAWNRFTLGNVPPGEIDQISISRLWVPAIFAYMFSAYFCFVMYNEYHNFLEKRVRYLRLGDPDTPPQAYYTVMVEKVPTSLRSAQAMADLFDNLFPGEVYSIQLACDLSQLDALVAERKTVRDRLEKAIAFKEATAKSPTMWVASDEVETFGPYLTAIEHPNNRLMEALGFNEVDSIDYYSRMLQELNESVLHMQNQFLKEEKNVVLPNHKPGTRSDAIKLVKGLDGTTKLIRQSSGSAVTGTAAAGGGNQGLGLLNNPPLGAAAGPRDRVDSVRSVWSAKEASRMSMDELRAANAHAGASLGTSISIGRPATADGERKSEEADAASASSSVRSPQVPQRDEPNNDRDDLACNSESSTSIESGLSADREEDFHRMQQSQTQQALQASYQTATDSPHSHNSDVEAPSNHTAWSMPGYPPADIGIDANTIGTMPVPMTPVSRQQTRRAEESTLEFLKGLPKPVEGVVTEGFRTVETAAKGALRGVLEATRTLELLTVGAYYKTSSTAFVTLRSRVVAGMCDQMQLSHRHYTMTVRSAPNPKDIRWENVMIPQRQIDMRRTIADITLTIGALFWSLVLGFITQISNLESMGREYSWIQAYSDTFIYSVFNSFLTSGMLLALLSVLPLIFDMIARNYEGLKLESEIQNSIMTRYFYYQLANVFVSIYAGSIITALHQILDSPSSLLSILGSTLPSFSIYFANLVIVKTFTAVPCEMLRLWPLAQIMSLKMCMDKKKWTWRELQTGAFKDPQLLYGWIYPSLMMVLMIVTTYACIAPFISPLGVIFYTAVYFVYKYQLLFVFINHYQSGGFMWYALFTRSMIALICAAVTLMCYLGFRRTIYYGPFYATLPLPFLILTFWMYCEEKFKNSSYHLSLESAIDLDRDTYAHRMKGFPPHNSFKPKLFRQPSLAEGPLRPGPYRPTVIIPGGERAFRSAKTANQGFSFDGSTNVGLGNKEAGGSANSNNSNSAADAHPRSSFLSNLFSSVGGNANGYRYQPIEGESEMISMPPYSGSDPDNNSHRGSTAAMAQEPQQQHDVESQAAAAAAAGGGGGHYSSASASRVGSYTSDQGGHHHMEEHEYTHEVDFSTNQQHAHHSHVMEVADILEFPLSPKMGGAEDRRRNLTPQRAMGSSKKVAVQNNYSSLNPTRPAFGGDYSGNSGSNTNRHVVPAIGPVLSDADLGEGSALRGSSDHARGSYGAL
jgi:hypothetical protein